jgi:Putative transposase
MAPSTTARSPSGCPNTRRRSSKPTSTAGCSAAASRGSGARAAPRAAWSRLAAKDVDSARRVWDDACASPLVQRTSSDMRLNPHLHVLFLDGAYHEDGAELVWNELGHLQTRGVGQVLENAVRRMLLHLRRHGLLELERGVGTLAVELDPLSLSRGPIARQGSVRWAAENLLGNRPSDPRLRRALERRSG